MQNVLRGLLLRATSAVDQISKTESLEMFPELTVTLFCSNAYVFSHFFLWKLEISGLSPLPPPPAKSAVTDVLMTDKRAKWFSDAGVLGSCSSADASYLTHAATVLSRSQNCGSWILTSCQV